MKKLVILAILGILITSPLFCMDDDQLSAFDMTSVSERGSESEDDFVISTVGYEPLPPVERGLPDIASLSLQQKLEPFEVYDDFAEQRSPTLKKWRQEHPEEQTPDYKARLAEEKSKTQSPEYQAWFKQSVHKKEYEERLWELEQEFARRSNFDFDPPVMAYVPKPEPTPETPSRPAPGRIDSSSQDYIRHMFNIHYNHVRRNRPQTKPTQQKEKRFPRTLLEAQFVAGNIYKTREERAAAFARDAKFFNSRVTTVKKVGTPMGIKNIMVVEKMIDYKLRTLRNMR